MEEEYTVSDLVSLSYDQKPIEFQQAFDHLIKDRLVDAIADKKMEVARTMFSGPDDTNDDDYDNAEIEDELDFEEDDEEEFLDQEEDQNG
jgi:hypothetical protein